MEFEYLGPYRVEKILGRGGMGTVYLGTHAKTGDSVALKVIASSLADQERFRRRFAAEVETLKRLKHANIVQLIGYGEEQGHLFYSMEYVAGKNLAETLKTSGRLTWDRALEIAVDVCGALKHAHDLGIIHRDLKPANVMLTEPGQVKLTDFGIAKLFGSSDVTAAGSVLGTADYMPPEQAEGKPVTIRSDLYALGSLLYVMVSGRSPHAAKSTPEVLYNVRYSVPPPLDMIVAETPPELSELVSHLLLKEISQRPPTALVVSNRLQSMLQGLRRRRSPENNQSINDVSGANEFASIDIDIPDPNTDLTDVVSRGRGKTQVAPPNPQHPEKRPKHKAEIEGLADAQTQVVSKIESQPIASQDDVVEPGKTRFTVVDDQDRQRTKFTSDVPKEAGFDSHWSSVIGLILLIAASLGSIFYLTRSPPADGLYEKISAAIESGSDDSLLDIEPVIHQFESLYPNDVRVAELTSIKNEIEQQRTLRHLLRRSRVVGSEAEMDPVEQAFIDCMRTQQQDTETGKRKLRAFLTIFNRRDRLTMRQQKLVQIAEENLEKLERGVEPEVNPAMAILNEQIDWAEENLSLEQRQGFYRAILELYADKSWADAAVARVRKNLVGEVQ